MEKILSNRLRRPVGRTIGSLIKEKEWLKALQVLQRHHAKRISKNTQCGGVSLLIFAILHDAPVNFINAILDQEIYAMISKTEAEKLAGMSPLHIACACGSSFEVIYALTKHGRENGLPNSATLIDKCRRTPLHHLMHHLCFPKEMDRGRAIFGRGIYGMGASTGKNYSDSSFTSFDTATSNTSKKLSFPFKKRIKKLPVCRSSTPPSPTCSLMSMNQVVLHDCVETLQYLVQVGPKAIFCRDIDGHCPIDTLHECKASHERNSRTLSWERADIGCVIFRSEMIKYYHLEKAKAERPRAADGVKKQTSIDGTNSTTDGSSVKSGSILSGLSKSEVDSLSLGQMNLSVCSLKGNKGTKWESWEFKLLQNVPISFALAEGGIFWYNTISVGGRTMFIEISIKTNWRISSFPFSLRNKFFRGALRVNFHWRQDPSCHHLCFQ